MPAGVSGWRMRGYWRVHEFIEGPVLALDTSTSSMTVALADGDAVLAERKVKAQRDHSVRLLPEIEELVRSVGMRPRDVRAIAVGRGPGSYTGVRIGVTAAKTFAWALGIPLYAVSTLEALALGGWREASGGGAVGAGRSVWVVPALDGRRGQAYTSLFEAGPGAAPLRRLVEDAVVPFREQLELWLQSEACPGTLVVAGEVDGNFAGMLEELAAGSQAVIMRQPWALEARDVAALARQYGEMARVDDVHDLLPNYTQLAEAEAKLLGVQAAGLQEVPDDALRRGDQ